MKSNATPAGAESPSAEQDDIRDLAIMLFDHIATQINRADTKAGLILAADTLFATTLAVLNKGVLLNLLDPALSLPNRAVALFTLLMFGALLISAFLSLVVARPILQIQDGGNTMFFFGQIAKMPHASFTAQFAGQSSEQIRESVLTEVHAQARIANQKFIRVRRSLDFLIAALALWAIIQAVQAITR